MQRTVTRQVRFCSGPDRSRQPFGAAPAANGTKHIAEHGMEHCAEQGLEQGLDHAIRTSFLCIYHVRSGPGCPDHEVQVLGDFYGADEVACRSCLDEESA
jgi:hypothetical protein